MPKDSPVSAIPFNRVLFLYACLTGVCLVLHNRMVDSAATDARKIVHQQVLSNTGPAPLQYRVMTFYLAEAVQRVGRAVGAVDPFTASYLIVRGFFTFLGMVLLHKFLRVYLSLPFAIMGVMLAFAWMPMTYINYYMQESDPANMVFYIVGYEFIRRRKDAALAGLLPIAMLNRETPVLLPLVWLLYRWDELNPRVALAKFAGFCGLAFGAYFGLRFLLGNRPAYAEFNDLALNLKSVNSYLYFFLLFGAVLTPALQGFSQKPKFLRRLALFLPFFLVFHFVIPIFQETRLFLPIFPILIALALTSWSPAPSAVVQEEERAAVSPLASHGKVLFGGAFVLFIAGIWLYLAYLEKAHVGELRGRQKAESYLERGRESFRAQDYVGAAREWEWGLLFEPNNFELHYNLAAVYGEFHWNADAAFRHLEACRAIFPDDPRLPQLEKRITEIRQAREQALRPPPGAFERNQSR